MYFLKSSQANTWRSFSAPPCTAVLTIYRLCNKSVWMNFTDVCWRRRQLHGNGVCCLGDDWRRWILIGWSIRGTCRLRLIRLQVQCHRLFNLLLAAADTVLDNATSHDINHSSSSLSHHLSHNNLPWTSSLSHHLSHNNLPWTSSLSHHLSHNNLPWTSQALTQPVTPHHWLSSPNLSPLITDCLNPTCHPSSLIVLTQPVTPHHGLS